MLEIRGHARGGQGLVTAFEILAKICSQSGEYHVQAFPSFGVERTGAPIQAYLRIAKGTILNRSNVYNPHLIVVFDETLIEQIPVFNGLRKNGAVLINSERDTKDFADHANKVYTVPATKISLNKGLGSKALPIVNSAMIGAVVKILHSDIESAKSIVGDNVPTKTKENEDAVSIAFNNVVGNDERNEYLLNLITQTEDELNEIELHKKPDIEENKINLKDLPRIPFWSQPISSNKTGSWRVLTPTYVERPAPCTTNCPAGTDVRLFVKLASEKKFDEAFKAIYEFNPFPSTCGRVCPHFCEQNCNRIELDEGLNVGAIERFLGDKGFHTEVKKSKLTHYEKIAVVGAGPAGLTAALRLTQKGYNTTVFEALPYAGGMMRTGIPQFRLPEDVLDKEIKRIEDHGVKIKLNKKVTIDELKDDFDALVVAVGSHIGTKMNIPNEELVIDGIEFLHKFKMSGEKSAIKEGDEVAVIGGGNTAIDVARTVLRLGSIPTIYYRRTRKEMPAIAHEVNEALSEGIKIEFLTAPVNLKQNNQIDLTIIKMELGEPDESGRRRPVPVKGSEKHIKVDKMITAIGQRSDEHVFAGQKIKAVQGRINSDFGIPVFCSGDMAWGGTVAEAIGSGNKVAEEVDAFFNDLPYSHEEIKKDIVIPADINFNYYLPTPRTQNPVRKSKNIVNDFKEVVKGLTETEVIIESKRCLHCGDCYSCGNCFNYCPDAAIFIDDENRLRIDYDYCKGCGICAQECPCSAISFQIDEAVYE
jgi:2-oxoacid:acceptor oxidoreductase gamma subunit (pyruvate/2-ketoisovalerate family)/2-oxoacid:acceptor oxidoreductase delta subunit (pyruvate/2-ketoisovalerate family)